MVDFLIKGFMYYFAIINIYAFIVMGYDKIKAKLKRYRVTERFIMTLAFIGGSFGVLLAMLVFRHKIRTKKFFIGVPVIIALHLILVFYVASFLDRVVK